jgi:xylulokinase
VARLLGIDIGTTGVRGAVYDASGAVLADHAVPCGYATPRTGWADGDADGWWSAAIAILGALSAKVSLESIDAIGVTGQAPTAVLVDGDGATIRPPILWLDTRADAEARAIDTALGAGRIEQIGGNRAHAYFLGPKLAWLKAHEPEAMDRAAYVLQSHAYLVMKLTGEARTDPSTAALCAPLYDVATTGWSAEGGRAVGVDLAKLPSIAAAHAVVGRVIADASRATGLREGTPVVAGGGDFAASTLAAGVVEAGEGCLVLGTAGNLLMPTRTPSRDARLINSHHVGCDRTLSLGGTLCGAALTWAQSAFGGSFDELEREATAVKPGAEGVVFLPYLQGERTPIWDVEARGTFAGLSLAHSRGHLYRAVLEAIASSLRSCRDVLGEQGVPLGELVATNGAGKSTLFRQILSDVLGAPLRYVANGGGTVAGAAILAGLGVGAVADPAIGRSWGGPGIRHVPDATTRAVYDDLAVRRSELYERTRGMSS